MPYAEIIGLTLGVANNAELGRAVRARTVRFWTRTARQPHGPEISSSGSTYDACEPHGAITMCLRGGITSGRVDWGAFGLKLTPW